MTIELKICPNCGSKNLHMYMLPKEVECNDCAEKRSYEEWQTDTPREKALHAALAESLKLQSHYADLLNMFDGGKRRKFASVYEWTSRLAELEDGKSNAL